MSSGSITHIKSHRPDIEQDAMHRIYTFYVHNSMCLWRVFMLALWPLFIDCNILKLFYSKSNTKQYQCKKKNTICFYIY